MQEEKKIRERFKMKKLGERIKSVENGEKLTQFGLDLCQNEEVFKCSRLFYKAHRTKSDTKQSFVVLIFYSIWIVDVDE